MVDWEVAREVDWEDLVLSDCVIGVSGDLLVEVCNDVRGGSDGESCSSSNSYNCSCTTTTRGAAYKPSLT